MGNDINLEPIQDYFAQKLETFGATPRGVDWNSEASQENRFKQLARILPIDQPYSLIDYGSGFGSLFDYLHKQNHQLVYFGYDIVPAMIDEGRRLHGDQPNCHFTNREDELTSCDYAIASGIFNIKLDLTDDQWTAYVVEVLKRMNSLTSKGFSFNLLTKYSDPEFMRPELYYADPCFFFDFCKRTFAKNVALLHDYGLYDFTILVCK